MEITEETQIGAGMSKAIHDHAYRRVMSGHGMEFPKYIYLGHRESEAFESMVQRNSGTPRYETGLSRDRTFMGARVIYVDEPSHLAVGD